MSPSRRNRGGVWTRPDLLRRLAEFAEARVPVVVVTVVESSGSAPGKTGAKMLVTAEGTVGTVGGGRVENASLARARELLESTRGPEILRFDVVQDLGMSCGGSMSLMVEPITPPPRLVILGAGHVAEPLCAAGALAGFDVTVVDERPEWLTAERFPAARERLLVPWSEAVERVRPDALTFIASVSPGHAVDRDLMRAVIEGGYRPRYLGFIGSERKATLLRRELKEAGLDPERVDAIRSPMGLPIGAVEPREIAISVVAELIAELRGGER